MRLLHQWLFFVACILSLAAWPFVLLGVVLTWQRQMCEVGITLLNAAGFSYFNYLLLRRHPLRAPRGWAVVLAGLALWFLWLRPGKPATEEWIPPRLNYRTIARAMAAKGDWLAPFYADAIVHDPNPADPPHHLAECLIRDGDARAADELLNAVRETGPQTSATWVDLGKSYFILKNYNASLDAFLRATRFGPMSWEIYLYAGRLRLAFGGSQSKGEALKFFEKALQMKPESLEVADEVARVRK